VWWELRILRERDGHSLVSLAKAVPPAQPGRKAGMSWGYLSDLENGRRAPSEAITVRLARALHVPVSVLRKSPRDAHDWEAA